jgi:hypothetical protein
MPDNEDQIAKGLAKSLGLPESQGADLLALGKTKIIEEYAALKANDPKIAELEEKQRDYIKRYAKLTRMSEAEAAAFLILPQIKMQKETAERRGKPKITEAELKKIIGADNSIPQDVLDMLEDENL